MAEDFTLFQVSPKAGVPVTVVCEAYRAPCKGGLAAWLDAQLDRHGFIARGGQAIDATLVPAPVQYISKADRSQLEAGQPPDWSEAQRRQKDICHAYQKAWQGLLWLQTQRERRSQAWLHSKRSYGYSQ